MVGLHSSHASGITDTLNDALAVPQIDLVGFSMGAVVALLAATTDQRIRRLAIVGVGAGVVELGGVDRRALPPEVLAAALVADDPTAIENPAAAAFRTNAEARGADLVALAAHAQAIHATAIPLHRITAPTLVLAGDADPFAERPEILASAIPGAQLKILASDHGTAMEGIGHAHPPATCRCIVAARRRDVSVRERRQEVVKESVSLDVKRAFPFRVYGRR